MLRKRGDKSWNLISQFLDRLRQATPFKQRPINSAKPIHSHAPKYLPSRWNIIAFCIKSFFFFKYQIGHNVLSNKIQILSFNRGGPNIDMDTEVLSWVVKLSNIASLTIKPACSRDDLLWQS